MYISAKKVAEEMVRRGIDPEDIRKDDFEDWTNTFMDSLEEVAGFEGKVCKVIERMPKRKNRCGCSGMYRCPHH
jgi:hypothetical protein